MREIVDLKSEGEGRNSSRLPRFTDQEAEYIKGSSNSIIIFDISFPVEVNLAKHYESSKFKNHSKFFQGGFFQCVITSTNEIPLGRDISLPQLSTILKICAIYESNHSI